MEVCIKSSEVARRLRGFGAMAYIVDTGPNERIFERAKYIKRAGLDLDALCREGRIMMYMSADMSSRQVRALVSREIRRQVALTASRAETKQVVAAQLETGAVCEGFGHPPKAELEVSDDMIVSASIAPPPLPSDDACAVQEKEPRSNNQFVTACSEAFDTFFGASHRPLTK